MALSVENKVNLSEMKMTHKYKTDLITSNIGTGIYGIDDGVELQSRAQSITL